MCPQAPTAEPTAALGRVLGCERIAAGPRAALIRVTFEAPGTDVAGAQLVVVDHGQTARCDALPSPPRGASARVTLGFAVTRTATPLGLVLGESSIAVAETDTRREIERELEDARSRLKESRSAYASIVAARREAMRAAARAEVAAHDATARAEELARELAPSRRRRWPIGLRWPAEGERHRSTQPTASDGGPRTPASDGGQPVAAADGGNPRRVGRLAVVAAGGVIPAALLVATLAWPAGDGPGDSAVNAVPAASASSVSPRAPAKLRVDRLALRLQIPARYLALYRQAAARYGLDWTRLAAIGAIESGHGQARIAGVVTGTNPDGASGPAQFLAGTWERFGLDGDGDGSRNPHSPADAIHAMASYLRASGAPQDWRAALRSYNHSEAYVDAVEKLAASLRSGAA